MITARDLVELLGAAQQLTYADEIELQTALAEVLVGAGLDVRRELVLTDEVSRIDLWVDHDGPVPNVGIGIEVKIAGSAASVTRQLERYAACPEISELILVTTRAKHHNIPRELLAYGVPLHLVSLVEAGL